MARESHPNDVHGWAKAAAGLALGLSLSACSVSFPLPGFVDSDATGTIKSRAVALSPDLDTEDWRRANAALAVALDPQGNGAEAAWHNPQSGAKGSFAAMAPPFLDHDRICRAFRARIAANAKTDRRLDGSACRNRDGDWILAEVKDTKALADPAKAGTGAHKRSK